MSKPICTVPDCTKPRRSKSAKWCAMHYHRWYRHGSVDKVATASGIGAPKSKYRTRGCAGHPLADKQGRTWEHRLVLFDLLGGADAPCHYCGLKLRWFAHRSEKDAMQVDHLNRVRDDNRPENLVPACRKCNVRRGMLERAGALRDNGWWSKNDTRSAIRSAAVA